MVSDCRNSPSRKGSRRNRVLDRVIVVNPKAFSQPPDIAGLARWPGRRLGGSVGARAGPGRLLDASAGARRSLGYARAASAGPRFRPATSGLPLLAAALSLAKFWMPPLAPALGLANFGCLGWHPTARPATSGPPPLAPDRSPGHDRRASAGAPAWPRPRIRWHGWRAPDARPMADGAGDMRGWDRPHSGCLCRCQREAWAQHWMALLARSGRSASCWMASVTPGIGIGHIAGGSAGARTWPGSARGALTARKKRAATRRMAPVACRMWPTNIAGGSSGTLEVANRRAGRLRRCHDLARPRAARFRRRAAVAWAHRLAAPAARRMWPDPSLGPFDDVTAWPGRARHASDGARQEAGPSAR